MSIQTVTTVLTDKETAVSQVEAAASFARTCDAHLQVLALGTGLDQPGVVQGALDAVPISASLEDGILRAKELAEIAEQELEKEDIRWDVDEVSSLTSSRSNDITRHIRFSDLVIQQRSSDRVAAAHVAQTAETVLFDGDCPLLLLPEKYEMLAPAKKVMVAWDESATALRAARLALPLLRRASSVYVAIVDPAKDSPDRSDPGGAFAQFLARHDVKCEVMVLSRTDDTVSQTIERRAQELGCDLVVMGAYGHSRLRQALFGGTTRHMLESAVLPVFLAH